MLPGVHERQDPGEFFGVPEHHQDAQGDAGAQGQEDVGDPGAAHKEHGEDDGPQGDGGAEIRFLEDQGDKEAGHQHVGQKADGEILHLLLLPGQGIGQEQDHGQLGELRRLEGQGTQAQPAGRAPDLAADARDKDQDQGNEGEQEDVVDPALVVVVVDAAPQEEGPEAQEGIDPLALDEIVGVVVLGLGHEGAGDEDHGHPQGQQGEGGDLESLVVVDRRGYVNLGLILHG